jgi:hypothetical protein
MAIQFRCRGFRSDADALGRCVFGREVDFVPVFVAVVMGRDKLFGPSMRSWR